MSENKLCYTQIFQNENKKRREEDKTRENSI